ncbi:MAG: hypothetical protein K5634_00190 [Sphaerochaetaceae bacterium]|nr:hypothetical protein [Sphaerochaetaceae bacterium]
MRKFRKLVEAGDSGLQDWAEKELEEYAETIEKHPHLPVSEDELVSWIGDADALLVRTEPRVPASVISRCPNLKYIGMCCSLYSKESANVDIDYSEKHGITVYGIRDYGDHGVTEYVIYQLVRILHGYDYPRWKKRPLELTGLKVGFVGFGTSGQLTARALSHLGAKIKYFARSRKEEMEKLGMNYSPLDELLSWSDVVITCLNRNAILLHEEQFKALGNGKIMINTSIGPASDMGELKKWIENDSNIFCSDSKEGVGEIYEELKDRKNLICTCYTAGMTEQAFDLLSRKVLDNIKTALSTEK